MLYIIFSNTQLNCLLFFRAQIPKEPPVCALGIGTDVLSDNWPPDPANGNRGLRRTPGVRSSLAHRLRRWRDRRDDGRFACLPQRRAVPPGPLHRGRTEKRTTTEADTVTFPRREAKNGRKTQEPATETVCLEEKKRKPERIFQIRKKSEIPRHRIFSIWIFKSRI